MVAEETRLPADLGLRADGTVAIANSRDVADVFEKEHKNVLRDIDNILTGSNLSALDGAPFRPVLWLDAKGEERRSFDLTRDGFTLLVMGWTGPKAMTFKVRYIQAFNAMEAALRDGAGVMTTRDMLSAIREIVAPLAVRFDGQDRALARVETRVDGLAQDLADVKHRLRFARKPLTADTKRVHVNDTADLGGRCPCCRVAEVTSGDGRTKAPFAEFDHFYANSRPDADHTWLICKPCHADLSAGRVLRHQREAEFRAYQETRRRLPSRQQGLALGLFD